MSKGFFITGTNTGVGKTYVGACIVKALVQQGLRVGIYKPVESGCEMQDGQPFAADAFTLWQAAGSPGELERVCPQKFLAPIAPHRAAAVEGKQIDTELLRDGIEYWKERSDVVLVEGAGGLMSPISDEDYNADLAEAIGFPLLVVAPNVLGTINQTLQTLITAAAFGNGLEVAGVILSDVEQIADESSATNWEDLASRCVCPLLARALYGSGLDTEIDWMQLHSEPI